MGWVHDVVEGIAYPLIGGAAIGFVQRRSAARRARSQGLDPDDIARRVKASEALRDSSVPTDPLDVPHFLEEIQLRRERILHPARWYRRPVPLLTLIFLGFGLTGPTTRTGALLLGIAGVLWLAQVSGAATWVSVRRLDRLEHACRKKFGLD